MRLTEQEQGNLDQLADAYTVLAKQYTDEDNRPLHVPHAVNAFAHLFFHDVFEDAAAMHARAEMAARSEAGIEDDDDMVVGFDMEPVIRKTYEMLILTGIEFGRRMNIIVQCRCAESLGDVVEEALRDGHCGH